MNGISSASFCEIPRVLPDDIIVPQDLQDYYLLSHQTAKIHKIKLMPLAHPNTVPHICTLTPIPQHLKITSQSLEPNLLFVPSPR